MEKEEAGEESKIGEVWRDNTRKSERSDRGEEMHGAGTVCLTVEKDEFQQQCKG